MAKQTRRTSTASYTSDIAEPAAPWAVCQHCSSVRQAFASPLAFVRHLRERHSTQEGGSFVCHYGPNGVCPSLPLDGVDDRDFEAHIQRCHAQPSSSTTADKWTVFSAAQNLPAVLNDPSRGKQSNLFTKKWGDAFVEKTTIVRSPHLLDITYDDFEGHMRKIGRRFRRHQRLNEMADEQKRSSEQDRAPSHNGHRTFAEHPASVVADIPAIFLHSQLELHAPNTFEQVFAGLSVASDAGRHSGRQLQEKLSHYLDVVEVQIAQQVSQKSSAFFHAMTSQDTIMAEMNAATANVQRLRRNIRQIDATLVNDSLTILSTERRRQHHLVALRKLKVMAEVHQTQPMIQLLLGTADYVAAIDLIGSTQELVAKELAGIHCFKHLPSQLHEMERLIDKMLTTDFEKYATADLNRPVSSTRDEPLADAQVLDEDKLVCIISGLLRQKNVQFIDTYKEEATATVRAMIKEMLIEVLASGDKEICLTGAGEESQALSISEWVTLLETATIRLLKLLGRIRAVVDVMHRVADVSAGRQRPDVFVEPSDIFLPAADYQRVDQRLDELMHSICNYCHERCATLISSQSLEKSVATADQVERLTRIVADFCVGCERLANVYSLPLQAALKAQATRFAQKFHADRKAKLGFILDNERWRQADVPPEFQYLIDGITGGGSFAPSDHHDKTKQTSSHVLLVNGEQYALVGSALILLQIIAEYCRCATQLPVVEAQLARHVVDLLRTFNSRCCQLVLGAGALRVAGLKTITSTNLALVSRALQLVVWLLPHIKRHFYRTTPPQAPHNNGHSTAPTTNQPGQPQQPSTLAGYDTVERDFVSHINELDAMILSIVGQLVAGQLDQWAARPPVPSQPFRNISRHFVKLHEAIAPILPVAHVHQLYGVVHRTFKDKLRELLGRNNIVNNGGPQHGVVTAELTFYAETLRTLDALPVAELADAAMADIWTR